MPQPVSTAPAPECLSGRELQVVLGYAAGLAPAVIAASLGTSKKTTDTHRGHALAKLRLSGNADLARYAMSHGLIDIDGNPTKVAHELLATLHERRERINGGFSNVRPMNRASALTIPSRD